MAFVLREVLNGLKYLHSKGIVHRSIRCSHILLNDNGDAVKLSGLRYACSLLDAGDGLQDRYDYPLHVVASNLNWLSPEFLQQNLLGYNERSDIYGLGVMACEAANGIVPFSELANTLIFLEKLRGASPKLLDSTTFDEDAKKDIFFTSDRPADSGVGASVGDMADSIYARRTFSDAFHDLVADCCRLSADERPSASQLISHPFIKQLKKTAVSMASILSSVKASRSKMTASKLQNDDDDQKDALSQSDVAEWSF